MHDWRAATGRDFYGLNVSLARLLEKYLVLKAPVTRLIIIENSYFIEWYDDITYKYTFSISSGPNLSLFAENTN